MAIRKIDQRLRLHIMLTLKCKIILIILFYLKSKVWEIIFVSVRNSFELSSPEFSRSPAASRPEIFAFYSKCIDFSNKKKYLLLNTDTAKISGREAVGDRENSGRMD
jgi:hypothetical protein